MKLSEITDPWRKGKWMFQELLPGDEDSIRVLFYYACRGEYHHCWYKIISMLHGWNIDPPRGGIMRRDGDLLAMKEIWTSAECEPCYCARKVHYFQLPKSIFLFTFRIINLLPVIYDFPVFLLSIVTTACVEDRTNAYWRVNLQYNCRWNLSTARTNR